MLEDVWVCIGVLSDAFPAPSRLTKPTRTPVSYCSRTKSLISVNMLHKLLILCCLVPFITAGPTIYKVDSEKNTAERVMVPVSSTGVTPGWSVAHTKYWILKPVPCGSSLSHFYMLGFLLQDEHWVSGMDTAYNWATFTIWNWTWWVL